MKKGEVLYGKFKNASVRNNNKNFKEKKNELQDGSKFCMKS